MSAHVDDQLLALMERRLPAAERARVAAHLDECPRCRAAAAALDDTLAELTALPGALPAMPRRTSSHWPVVWARVRDAGAVRRLSPRVSVYLGLVTSLVVVVLAVPTMSRGVPASVTAGVAAGPQLTQPATLVARAEGTVAQWPERVSDTAVLSADGTAAIAPVPIPTPVPGP